MPIKFSLKEPGFFHAGLIVSLITSVVGLLLIFWAEASALTCRRVGFESGNCELVTLSGPQKSQQVQRFPLEELQKAEVDISLSTSSNSSPKSKTYRVVLLTERGEIPVTSYSTGDAEPVEAFANEVNRFIGNPGQTSLTVQQDDRWLMFLIGGIVILVGNGLGGVFIYLGVKG